jgi:LacI family transcriptional regulator
VEPEKKATIKDVAKEAQVSIATVSRVINENYYVSPDIEERVRLAIEKTGYIPDSIARSMKSNTTYLIGLLVSDISNQHFTAMARAIEDGIRGRKYNLIVCSTENDEQLEKAYIQALISKKIAGIILNTTGKNDEFIAKISRSTPISLVYRRIRDNRFLGDLVTTNNARGTYDLTRYVLDAGHKRIGIITGFPGLSTSQERFEGCARALAEAGLAVAPEYVIPGDFTQQAGYKAAELLMGLPAPPTAIVAFNNAMTLGAMKHLRKRGIRVPEDVSVVCYGDIDDIDLMYVQPTYVTQNPRVIGAKAAELMLSRIADGTIGNREVIFESTLCPGNSVAAPG